MAPGCVYPLTAAAQERVCGRCRAAVRAPPPQTGIALTKEHRMSDRASTRPALALLAGLLCDEEIWADVASRIATHARVTILSFRGFSSIAAMAEHVQATMTGRFAVAGHSMGGRVALELFRRERSRITGVALLNTGIHPVAAHEPESRGRLVRLARERGMAALAAEWLPPMMGPPRPADDNLMRRLIAMVERSTPEQFAAQVHALLHRPEVGTVLADVDVPLLLLSADRDQWSPVTQHEAMRRLCPAAALRIVQDAGHMAPVEQPGAVADALMDWIAMIVTSEDQRSTD
jgi:pimeloyl-ACP methyl ester carboxylesterase